MFIEANDDLPSVPHKRCPARPTKGSEGKSNIPRTLCKEGQTSAIELHCPSTKTDVFTISRGGNDPLGGGPNLG